MSIRTLSDMMYSIKDAIGLHASRGCVLGDVLDKLKINRIVGLQLIKTIMTNNNNNNNNSSNNNKYDNNDDDNDDNDVWLYTINNNKQQKQQYNEILFNDIMTDLYNIIIYSPKSQWWKSFGLKSIEMINFISLDDMKIKITEIVAMAGNDGVIVTEFSKLLNLPVQSYHYFIDNLVAHDILTKRIIIPINKKDSSVIVPKGQGIKAIVNIVHLKRFANNYNPMIHYACIEYDSETKSMLMDVIQSALSQNNKKSRSALSVKTLSKVLNLTKNEANDVKFVVNAPDDEEEDMKVDDSVPFNSYLRSHTIYDQVRMLVMGTPEGICTDTLRTVLKIELKKARNLIDKFKNEFKYPTQEKLHNYNYSTFLLAKATTDSAKEKEDTMPPEYKDLTPNQIRNKVVMTIMNTPGKGIEVAREMNEKVQAEITRLGMPFKMDRKMVQKTCQSLHDEKKVILSDMQLPEGVLLFKLPEIRIVSLPEVFSDTKKVEEFMYDTIERLKPGAQKKPKPEATPKTTRKPPAEKVTKPKTTGKSTTIKVEDPQDTSDSESKSSDDDEHNDDDDDDNDDDGSEDNYDLKLERVLRQTATKRGRNDLDDDSDVDELQAKKLKKLARSVGMDESGDDDDSVIHADDQNDVWTPLQEAYALQYHLLNCLQRTSSKKIGATTLLPWNSIILRNLDTLDLSYIYGRSFTKEQLAKVGKKWAMIKSHLFKALKTYNTIRKILALVLSQINPLDKELAELLNGILDPQLFEKRRRDCVTDLEQVAMTKALRVCADENNGSLDVLNAYSSSIKVRVENELLSSQLIQGRASDVTGNEPSVPAETMFELSDIKVLSAERASFHYNLSKLSGEEKDKIYCQNIINMTEALNPKTKCIGELHLIEIDHKNEPIPLQIKLHDGIDTVDDTNGVSLSTNTANTGHYHEHLNRINTSLKIDSRANHANPPSPPTTTAPVTIESSSNELSQFYDKLIKLVQEAGNSGVSTVKVIKLISNELKKDVDIESLNVIIRRGIQEKLIFQIYDFVSDPGQTYKPSLLVDIQHESLYRVNDGDDGTCPWINTDGILNTNFFMKLKANMKALLTSTPGADFTLLHSHFPYLTIYQMETLLKRFIKENFITQRYPTMSITLNNPFDSSTTPGYPTKPCYFLFN